MTTEQPKSPPPPPQPQQPPQDQSFAAGTMAAPAGYPHGHFNGGTYPPPPAPPGTQFMYPYPPGMLYAYPPTMQGPPIQLSTSPAPIPSLKPKRKQVKMACTNCATACKRCDESRPCERCVKYGMSNSCVDGQRKERKKGVKRGPYKRKNKNEADAGGSPTYTEWQNAGTVPPATAAPAAPAMAPLPPFHAGAPEGFYPVYYPGFMPQQPQDGHPPVDGAHPPQQMVPMFIPGFPPYHYPPPPGAVYAAPHMHPHLLQPPPPVPPASTAAPGVNGQKKADANGENTTSDNQAPSPSKPSKKKGKGSSASTSSPVTSPTATTGAVEQDTSPNGNTSSGSTPVDGHDDDDDEDEDM